MTPRSTDGWQPGDQDRRKSDRDALNAAAQAAQIVAEAARMAASTVAESAKIARDEFKGAIMDIKADIASIKIILDSKYVTKEAFAPVKLVTYGLVSLICVAVVGALMTLILVRP